MSSQPLNFEEALVKLESIAEQIERGQIGLEDSIARYEEGMALVRQCRDLLTKAELRIQQIHQRSDGTLDVGNMPVPPERA